MASRAIQTSIGPVTVNGRVLGGDAPAILVIRGWASRNYLDSLLQFIPDVDILLGDLPGMWSESPKISSPESFARAYDEVITQLLHGRRIVALGASTGALVTLGLASPEVRIHVLMEPFFSLGELWPLIEEMRNRLGAHRNDESFARYVFDLYGLSENAIEPRDLSYLLDGTTKPVHAIVGDLPLLPKRKLDRWPSLSDSATRARLMARPNTFLHPAPAGSGHDITATPGGWELVSAVLRKALSAA